MTIPIKRRINALGEFEPEDAVPIEHGGTGASTLLDAQNILGITDKLDRSEYIQHFKGVFVSYSALSEAFPTANDGDYAHIDSGANFDRMVSIWDSSDNKWVINQANTGANTDEVPEGSQNLYFTSQRVLNTKLSGLVAGTSSDILATDSIIVALQKLQAQLKKVQVNWVDVSNIATYNSALDLTRTKIEISKSDGQIHIRGYFRLLSALSAVPLFTINSDSYFVDAPDSTTNGILRLAPILTWTPDLSSPINLALEQNSSSKLMTLTPRANISSGATYMMHHIIVGKALNPS
ncbi:hypothetical protein [Acinetobacter bereziniae]|uniref:hypothetical protein n=1 Tax=Acinetobacter bereziniae TaxID=106648 RepID=UPI0018FFA1E4|nr:hypothetical protein [Acinetobacter bereziniae]MBJ8424574.1 hypothetical protein [Acinetobacter bereziniae]